MSWHTPPRPRLPRARAPARRAPRRAADRTPMVWVCCIAAVAAARCASAPDRAAPLSSNPTRPPDSDRLCVRPAAPAAQRPVVATWNEVVSYLTDTDFDDQACVAWRVCRPRASQT